MLNAPESEYETVICSVNILWHKVVADSVLSTLAMSPQKAASQIPGVIYVQYLSLKPSFLLCPSCYVCISFDEKIMLSSRK